MDFSGLASACHNSRVFLVHHDRFRTAQVFQTDRFKLDPEVFGDGLAAREDRNVFHHRFAPIAEAGSLHRTDTNGAAQSVHDERGERFALDVFSNDQQRLARLSHLFEDGEEFFEVADLLLVKEHVSVLEFRFHRLRVGYEVGREIAFVELHAFHNFERRRDRFGFLHSDRAVLAYFVHGISDDFANGAVPVGRDCRDLLDLVLVLDLLGDSGEMFHGHLHGLLDAALNANRVRSRSHKF